MTTTMIMKTDAQIQQDVLLELKWDTRVKATDIGVEVDDGIVTLTGTVDSYAKKLAAREAAHRVSGVLNVADDVEVRLPGTLTRNDTDIASAIATALKWDVFLPETKIASTVSKGWVTLEGNVEYLMDKEDAENAVRRLHGVTGVTNNIKVVPKKADAAKVRQAIEDALERRAEKEAEKIHVRVDDGKVTLDGQVHSWAEKQAVVEAVRFAPGVRFVDPKLSIEPYF